MNNTILKDLLIPFVAWIYLVHIVIGLFNGKSIKESLNFIDRYE